MISRRKIGGVYLALLVGGLFLALPRTASAQYVQNNLIDDSIFLNAASMNQSQIQTFLNDRGGYLARYTTYSGRDSATVPASQIIYEAAQDYGVNPQAIMATLQKEQSLITATNPTASQLNYAMGYGCPDSSGCSTTYPGFFNQVDNATWQLRFNLERARGNNTWWNSAYHYACGGTTRYYSTGLYAGRYVTFYNDYGTAYQSFTINDAATASLYCYTPHAYPGSSQEYYSGSYNFVTSFEQWFGSTQPTVVVSSPIRMSALPAGVFANYPITISFDLRNNTNASVNVGSMMVAVRDANGNNYDFGFTPMTIAGGATATYSATTTLANEGIYTFWITNLSNGQWNDNYPVSSLIDNTRKISNLNLQAIPIITQSPASSVTALHAGQPTTVSFQVKNNSTSPMNLGNIGLAIRGPNGQNLDVGYDNIPALAAGSTYVYSKVFTPPAAGQYQTFLTDTTDGGMTWDQQNFPASTASTQRTLTITSADNPTIVTGIASSDGTTARQGQQSQITFQIHNFSAQSITLPRVGVTIRDSSGANLDPGWDDNITITAGQTYTYNKPVTWGLTGNWKLAVASYSPSTGWSTIYPTTDNTSIQTGMSVAVKDNPTVTAGVAISPASPRVGQAATVTYTVTNFANQTISMPPQGLAVRDANGNNLDPGWATMSVAGNGTTYTYSKQVVFQNPGMATLTISTLRNGVWTNNYPVSEPGQMRQLTVNILPSPTVVTSLSSSVASPHQGNTSTLSFQVKNFGDAPVQLGRIGLIIRDPQGMNRDPLWDNPTIAPGQTYTYSVNVMLDKVGTWNIDIGSYANQYGWSSSYPVNESNQIVRSLGLAVAN